MGNHKVAIFDVDGTLYDQGRVRTVMAVRLGVYYLLHPFRFRELKGLYFYRKIREEQTYQDCEDQERISVAASLARCGAGVLTQCIRRWMFEKPLDLIWKYRNKQVLSYMDRLRERGYRIAIYSDFPVEEKLSVLGITADWIFYPGPSSFQSLKPSKEAAAYILSATDADTSSTVYVGDRDEKDGEAAAMMGVKYINAHTVT